MSDISTPYVLRPTYLKREFDLFIGCDAFVGILDVWRRHSDLIEFAAYMFDINMEVRGVISVSWLRAMLVILCYMIEEH